MLTSFVIFALLCFALLRFASLCFASLRFASLARLFAGWTSVFLENSIDFFNLFACQKRVGDF